MTSTALVFRRIRFDMCPATANRREPGKSHVVLTSILLGNTTPFFIRWFGQGYGWRRITR